MLENINLSYISLDSRALININYILSQGTEENSNTICSLLLHCTESLKRKEYFVYRSRWQMNITAEF